MLLRSWVRTTGEPTMPKYCAWSGRDNAVDNRISERVMRGAVESGGLRVLSERDDHNLSRVRVGNRNTVAAAREDGDNNSDAGV